MAKWLWIAGAVVVYAAVGAAFGTLAALSHAMDTEPLAPFGFDDEDVAGCPDVIPEWMVTQ